MRYLVRISDSNKDDLFKQDSHYIEVESLKEAFQVREKYYKNFKLSYEIEIFEIKKLDLQDKTKEQLTVEFESNLKLFNKLVDNGMRELTAYKIAFNK